MAVASLIYTFWACVFQELYLVAAIIVTPIIALASVAMIPFAVFEFLVIDVWVFLFALLSKDMTVGDVFWYFFDGWE